MNHDVSPALTRAAEFLHQAHPLERALFAFHFEGGSADAARAELLAFQNADGGFHGLEPDVGFTTSSALCTCKALHLLHDLATGPDRPSVRKALDYLLATYDATRGVWPIIPPHDNSAPHAPWWHSSPNAADQWQGYVDNPRPDVLACLLSFPVESTAELQGRVAADTLARLKDSGGKIEMHGLLCYIRLEQAPNVPVELKKELRRVLPAAIDACVERDPAKWGGYGLRPLDVAPFSDSPWRASLADTISAQIDYLVRTQGSDGSWSPHWNWGDAFPAAWPQAKRKWQEMLTLANVRTLRSYGI